MNWKLKSIIQNLVAKLPSSLGYTVYYFIQRRFGGLRESKPTNHLRAAITMLEYVHKGRRTIQSKTFLEIGTGRRLNLATALWLCGASKIITIDMSPYLREELVFEDTSYMRSNQHEIESLFGSHSRNPILVQRFEQLTKAGGTLGRLLDMMNIQYRAPADAGCLDLPSRSVDYHVSSTVVEHIPPRVLEAILSEGKRCLKKDGSVINFIGLADHFSHSDKSITTINFLQFSESQWERYAGNRYAYHNRLRIDDFADLFEKVGLRIVSIDSRIDPRALEELRKGFPLNARFSAKSPEVNAAAGAWVVAKQ